MVGPGRTNSVLGDSMAHGYYYPFKGFILEFHTQLNLKTMTFKRLTSLIFFALFSTAILISCGGKQAAEQEEQTEEEHPAESSEHPAAADSTEHPSDSSEHPSDSTNQQ